LRMSGGRNARQEGGGNDEMQCLHRLGPHFPDLIASG
jgi:hypothetical protein